MIDNTSGDQLMQTFPANALTMEADAEQHAKSQIITFSLSHRSQQCSKTS